MGLFCHFWEVEFGNEGPLTSTIYQGIKTIGHPYQDLKEKCCRKCKDEHFNLPVIVDKIYVILPENIFRFSKVFKSFIKLTDCMQKNAVLDIREDDHEYRDNSQENIDESDTDADDWSEEESEDNTDISSLYNSFEHDSTNCGGFSGNEY